MKTNTLFTSLTLLALLTVSVMPVQAQFDWPYHIDGGRIVTDVPTRPAGQKDAYQLRTAPLPVVRVGFVGLGMRGPGAVERFTHIDGTQVMALCDYERQRAEACQTFLEKASLPPADIYSGEKGYEELCRRNDIDLVYIATDWRMRELCRYTRTGKGVFVRSLAKSVF